jgi:putative radical SAM enzyme (TIGR03279 family)
MKKGQLKGHTISRVTHGSSAERAGLVVGDTLLAINGTEVEDIFDYRYLIQDEQLRIRVLGADGSERMVEAVKDYYEDLGVEFENPLLDEYRSCCNKCIFCFIDQMPPGMRETLYFKDDDSRLSFLQGNYVTLTNMSDHDLDRIIQYHLSPINISVHTMNPELRCEMLHNRFAGDALKKIKRLYDAGISMNAQVVLCPGINDGAELDRTIRELYAYMPHMESLSVVPVGLTKYREGLYPLRTLTEQEAAAAVDQIEAWQKKIYQEQGTHFVQASDEFYILCHRPLPEEERYDGYNQLENGVGMIRLLTTEVQEALKQAVYRYQSRGLGRFLLPGLRQLVPLKTLNREVSIATGRLAYPYMKKYAQWVMKLFTGVQVHVYSITNDFFGHEITVAGLITGQDLMKQLKGKQLGDALLLPAVMFRSGEEVFLDDYTRTDLENALQVPVNIVKSSGQDLVDAILGFTEDETYAGHSPYELERL